LGSRNERGRRGVGARCSGVPIRCHGEFIFALARIVGGIIVLTLIDMYFGSRLSEVVHATLTQHGQSTAAYDDAHLKARYQSIGSIGWTVAWLLYWRSSERVRLTFSPDSGMKEIPRPT
jgi:hypothetical protein